MSRNSNDYNDKSPNSRTKDGNTSGVASTSHREKGQTKERIGVKFQGLKDVNPATGSGGRGNPGKPT